VQGSWSVGYELYGWAEVRNCHHLGPLHRFNRAILMTMHPDKDAHMPDAGTVPVLEEAVHSNPRTLTEEVIPIAEEIVQLNKRETVTGTVRVQTVTDTVEEIAKASLQKGAVDVTRVPIDRVVDVAPSVRTEDGVVIVPVVEEVLVTEKRLVLKEEVHIRRRVDTEEVEVPITLRKQRAVVERTDPGALEGEG